MLRWSSNEVPLIPILVLQSSLLRTIRDTRSPVVGRWVAHRSTGAPVGVTRRDAHNVELDGWLSHPPRVGGLVLCVPFLLDVHTALNLDLSLYPSIHLSINPSIHSSDYLSIYIHLSINQTLIQSCHFPIYLCIYTFIRLSIHPSIYRWIYPCIYPSILGNGGELRRTYVSIYLNACVCVRLRKSLLYTLYLHTTTKSYITYLYISIYLSIHPSIYLSIYIYIYIYWLDPN